MKTLVARDLYAEIVLMGFIEIRFGTFYEKFTPFTLYAPIDLMPLRSELFFSYYQEDLYTHYLYHKNCFPLEGVRIKFELLFPDIGSYNFNSIAAKLANQNTPGNSFDRYLFGVNNNFKYSKVLSADLTWVSIQDIKETGTTNYNKPLRNHVISAAGEFDVIPLLFTEKAFIKGFGVEGEIAASSFDRNTWDTNTKTTNGFANRISIFANINDQVKIRGGYHAIEYEYIAPGAQTRFATPGGEGTTFEEAGLDPFLFDYDYQNNVTIARLNDDTLNFTYSMNTATPNRMGIFGDIGINLGIIKINSEASIMQEMRPIAAPNENTREFLRGTGEVSFPLDEFLKEVSFPWEEFFNINLLPEISFFGMMENITRDDDPDTSHTNWELNKQLNEEEDCMIIGFGGDIVVRLLESLALTGMYQEYRVTGRKTMDAYGTHEPLEISGYTTLDYAIRNLVYGGGLILSFTKSTSIQLDYLIKTSENKTENIHDPLEDLDAHYKINHFRMLFLMKF